MISDLTASKQAAHELGDAESSADQGQPLRLKKGAVKKAPESAATKSTGKARSKRR